MSHCLQFMGAVIIVVMSLAPQVSHAQVAPPRAPAAVVEAVASAPSLAEPPEIQTLRALRERELLVSARLVLIDDQRRALSHEAGGPTPLILSGATMIAGFSACAAVVGVLAFTQFELHHTPTAPSRSLVRALAIVAGVGAPVGLTGMVLYLRERNDPARLRLRELLPERRVLEQERRRLRRQRENLWSVSPELAWQGRRVGLSLSHAF